ncbi:S1 family peptidase [Streptomyces albiaxialis]|uniref:S1 family peptidase n=1 Tax=Streptomyces albiaxialis TaxID=329523 RepID=UPI0031D15B43
MTAALAVASGIALTVGGIQTMNVGSSQSDGGDGERTEGITAAYAKARNMSVDEAETRLNRQEKLVKTDKKLKRSLKPEWSGGTWIDQKSGKLVVGVTDERHEDDVEGDGTETRLIKYSAEDLEKAKRSVDKLAERFSPRGATWYVDVRANAVTVKVAKSTLDKGKTRQFVDAARALGPVVKVRTTEKPVSSNVGITNGKKIESTNGTSCSAGWWVKDKSGADLIMTAGHCTDGGHSLWRYNGLHFGGTTNTSYEPMDWGTIHVDDIAAPRPTTGVDMAEGDHAKISGLGKAPVGTEICKSGYRSGQTCGPILAHDITVTYTDGTVLEGMSSANLVSDSGDSGGSVYQMDPEREDTHVIAQGLLSGSTEGTDEDDTMYYQPIESALLDGDLIFVKSMD